MFFVFCLCYLAVWLQVYNKHVENGIFPVSVFKRCTHNCRQGGICQPSCGGVWGLDEQGVVKISGCLPLQTYL